MSDEKQLTVYDEMNAATLVNQYEEEFQTYKSELKLNKRKSNPAVKKGFSWINLMTGSFLAISAVGIIGVGNYLDYRVQMSGSKTNQTLETSSWVFPVYFIAGVFSVSSVLAFRKAIR